MGDVYHTPQYKIDALTKNGQLQTNVHPLNTEYLYEDGKGPNPIPPHIYPAKEDGYVLPPQGRHTALETRPRKEQKQNVEDLYDEDHYTLARNSGFAKDFSRGAEKHNVDDIYDEDHYTLARNSGFGKDFSRKAGTENVEGIYDDDHYNLARNSGFGNDFSKSGVSDSKVTKKEQNSKIPIHRHMVVICIVVIMFAVGGILAYVMIDRIGKSLY